MLRLYAWNRGRSMHIGLTYDLRSEYLAAGFSEEETAEFDREETVATLDQAIRSNGHTTDRIGNAKALMGRLSRGDRWELVFNVCEGMYGIAREAQVPAILDVYDIAYTFSDPLVMALTLHKGLTKTIVRAAGIPTPDFSVVERPEQAAKIELPLPLFAKPVAEGTGKGVSPTSKITDRATIVDVCSDLLARFRQSVLIETYLPGREFTVGLVGTGASARALGTLEIVLLGGAEPEVYSYVNKERCEELVDYRLVHAERDLQVREAERVALNAWRVLGCRDAGRVDLRCDADGRPSFMEVNPLSGLHPSHSDLPMLCTALGMSYEMLIGEIINSAALRVKR
jgi:D-alanine-D-alanine ligase